MIPGKYYNTSEDRILIVGAHWDTYGLSPGFNDNGSGVAALLEVARVLATASCYQPDYSVFFVAFDAEESGCRGSQEFVYTHLGPHLKATGGTTQGAFILDTILNFDSRKNSQKFSKVHRVSLRILFLQLFCTLWCLHRLRILHVHTQLATVVALGDD